MRLTSEQIDLIRTAVTRCYGEESAVYVFGSRLDDTRRGGDIDLLVVTPLSGQDAFDAEQRLHGRLQRLLGERKIDIITHSADTPLEGVRRHALEAGVRL
ncbi:nucleotidyltransferase domain-containing protein [Aquisalimonas sp. APHAB1-3]|uniref:nucleotidyltransferase domain-containing protein n=1 Tax=Aquisalimonas sp. APHAB1-3 TaxID=3402080 RepID=UPI003AAB648F